MSGNSHAPRRPDGGALQPLNALLGGVMFYHQRHVFRSLNVLIRQNKRGLLFYFFCYQYVMSPTSLAGYGLEAIRARRTW